MSDYARSGERVVAALLHRKDDPHDLVLQEGPGRGLHHVGYVAPETHHLIRATDAACQLKFSQAVELGPVRHGHSYRLYLRDPDGHRLALLLPPIQIVDADDGRVRHDAEYAGTWGLSTMLTQHATPFADAASVPPLHGSARPKRAGLREAGSRYVADDETDALRQLPEISELAL